MSIEFRCEHCERKIQAPNEAGGKMGKCPSCGHGIYVPLPADQESEPLELSEIDPAEEARCEEEMAQTRQTMRRLWSERPKGESAEPKSPSPPPPARAAIKTLDPEEAAFTVEQYVVAMARVSLDEAEALAAHLLGHPQIVNPLVKRAIKEGLKHSSLKNIPLAVQQGFLKKLLEYLNQE